MTDQQQTASGPQGQCWCSTLRDDLNRVGTDIRNDLNRMGNEIGSMLKGMGPSEQVVGHFRSARIEVLKGFRQMIDDRIARAEAAGQTGGTKFGVE
jgi:hypothetical protein